MGCTVGIDVGSITGRELGFVVRLNDGGLVAGCTIGVGVGP